jgi:type IV pilus assembly protein PilB
MTSDQILDILQKQGVLDAAASARVKRESLVSNRSAEDIIHEQRLVDDQKMAEAKSAVLKVPYQKVDLAAIDSALIALIPEETVRTYGVVPLAKRENLLVAGMLSPDDSKAQEALKFIARRNKMNLGIYLVSYDDWQAILRKYSPYKNEIEAAVKSLNLKPSREGVVDLEATAAAAGEDAPVIRIVRDTLKEAVQAGASDVHIEPQQNYLRVRFRESGDLHEIASLPIELAQPVISRVKVMSNLRIDETRIPQDGRFRAKIFDREIDFRISTFPTPSGEKVAIRVLDPKTGLKTLDQLGLTGKSLEIVKAGIEKPFGMILISGPTGSGKSTTLYALMQLLNTEEVNIVSLEDPVEYFITGINQSQVRPEIGYYFASGLRQILRQDPDVIMVGEIRDDETAGLGVHAALTGHIVLSTIHTNNSAGVIPRLIDMKVEAFLLPSALNLMLSQRLVSQICPDCKKAEPATAPIQKIIKETISALPAGVNVSYKEPYQVYRGAGCNTCKGKGVVGRVAIFEVIQMTNALEDIINTSPTTQKIIAEARKQGFVSMREDGVIKALDGLVLIEEVLRESE